MYSSVVTLLFVQVAFCQGACPDFWTPFQGSCYHLFSELEQWTQAEVMCTLDDANLVTIETSTENNFVKNLIRNTNDHQGVWLGANDIVNEGDFIWVASHRPLTYTDWGPLSPDNANNNQNCLQFWYHDGFWQWDDSGCTEKGRFICEKSNSAVVG